MMRTDVLGNPMYYGKAAEIQKEKKAAAVRAAIRNSVADALFYRREDETVVEKRLVEVEGLELTKAKKIIASVKGGKK